MSLNAKDKSMHYENHLGPNMVFTQWCIRTHIVIKKESCIIETESFAEGVLVLHARIFKRDTMVQYISKFDNIVFVLVSAYELVVPSVTDGIGW